MPKKTSPEATWSDVKKSIRNQTKTDLIKLVGELYRLSSDNRDFLHARFSVGPDPLSSYRQIIRECMYPDVMENDPVRFSKAKRAISNYAKAADDLRGEAELMAYYVECRNQFTLDYGDIDGVFYDSLLSMYGRAIKKIKSLPEDEQEYFRVRLEWIMLSSHGIGWGYHDGLADHYYEAFPEVE